MERAGMDKIRSGSQAPGERMREDLAGGMTLRFGIIYTLVYYGITKRYQICSRRDIVKAPVAKRLVPPYAEILPLIVRHLDVLEILAEKVRALMTREKARDLYDIHFLLKKGVRPDRSLVESKLSFYDVRLSRTGIRNSVASKKKLWKNELTPLLPSGPMDFVTVSREVREGMDALFVR